MGSTVCAGLKNATLAAVAGLVVLAATSTAAIAAAGTPGEARTINWDVLLPEKERGNQTPAAPPAVHDYLGEGSLAALQTGSYETDPALNGARIRLPGFVVPLERSADGLISEFLLVPYFGACIHVPPPAPNQVVYVRMKRGAGLKSIDDAVWVSGTLHTSVKKSDLASAAYVLDGEKLELYTYGR